MTGFSIMQKEETSVSIVRCHDYDPVQIGNAVEAAVNLIGGVDRFVKPGQVVLLKPNLLKASPPSAAVVTHPEVVRSVIRMVRRAGGKVLVGDSPGFGDLRRVCEKTGLLKVIEEEGALLADMDDAVTIGNRGQFHHFEISRSVRDADVVINLPKLKTHGMTTITGAVKNLFGCIPGRRKVQWHFNTGVNHKAFARMLVELSALIRPGFTIMDAVVGMEGNGPGSGDPRQIGLILAGADPVAIDVVSALIVDADPKRLPVLRAAAEACIGETRPENIQILGEQIRSVIVKDFRFPPQAHLEWPIPEWLRGFLKDALTTRPVVSDAGCIRCSVCQSHCPQQAISQAEKLPQIDYRRCIRCFCCQEFCPRGAITVGRGWALKILS